MILWFINLLLWQGLIMPSRFSTVLFLKTFTGAANLKSRAVTIGDRNMEPSIGAGDSINKYHQIVDSSRGVPGTLNGISWSNYITMILWLLGRRK